MPTLLTLLTTLGGAGISSIITGIGKLFGIADPDIAAKLQDQKFQLELQRILAEIQIDVGQLDLAKKQADINLAEAATGRWFIAGWRPAVGWVGAIALACFFIPPILISTLFWTHDMWVAGHALPFPMDITSLMTLMTGMLGLGGLRTWEKLRDVAFDAPIKPLPSRVTGVVVPKDSVKTGEIDRVSGKPTYKDSSGNLYIKDED